MIYEERTLHVGDTFTYKGTTYKAEKAKLIKSTCGIYGDCKGCSLFTEKSNCERKPDMPLCSQDWQPPLIFVEQ